VCCLSALEIRVPSWDPRIPVGQIKTQGEQFGVGCASAGAHAKRINTGATPRAHPELSASDALFVPVEEVVVGGVRHERLLPHIAEHGATGCGGRSSLGVQTLNERGLSQEVTAS
jgi:hypothetical protein